MLWIIGLSLSTDSLDGEALVHEMGHGLGKLADEYTYDGATVGCDEALTYEENIQIKFIVQYYPRNIKWNVWVNPETPIPTGPPYYANYPGAYEGARYYCLNLYRPTFDSEMRNLYREFEQVNTEQLIRRIYEFVSVSSASQPAAFNVTAQQGQMQQFAVTVPTRTGNALVSLSVKRQQYKKL